MEFKKVGGKDYMGFTWYGAYENGKKVLIGGEHLQYHALDSDHAKRMHEQ